MGCRLAPALHRKDTGCKLQPKHFPHLLSKVELESDPETKPGNKSVERNEEGQEEQTKQLEKEHSTERRGNVEQDLKKDLRHLRFAQVKVSFG